MPDVFTPNQRTWVIKKMTHSMMLSALAQLDLTIKDLYLYGQVDASDYMLNGVKLELMAKAALDALENELKHILNGGEL